MNYDYNGKNHRRFLVIFALLIALVFGYFVFASDDAKATESTPTPCVPSPSVPATPGTPEVPAVTEVVHHEAVYSTEYHFRKFTRIKTQAPAVAGFWQNFQPNKQQGKFTGPPTYPTDARGTWSAPKKNGGPQPTASGVFQNGSGNGSWFYRQQGTAAGAWSEFSDWTPWEPETHSSWEDSNAPLGTPQFHGQGTYADGTKWYREWQALFDGQTRQGALISEAYDEVVVITPAIPAVPGTPEIPAVTCPEPPSDEPTTPTETPTVPTETPTVPTETPTVPTETPTVPTETPTVPTETPTAVETPFDDGGDTVIICGVVVKPPKAGEPVPRDILCPLPPTDDEDKVIKTETRSEPTRSVKIYTHESGKTTKVVKNYGSAEDLVEEGL